MEDGMIAAVETDIPALGAENVDPGVDPVGEQEDQAAAEPQHGQEGTQQAIVRAIENGKLSQPVKDHLDKLKAENPALARAISNAIFHQDRLSKALGADGIKGYTDLRSAVEQAGGLQAIRENAQQLQFFSNLDNLYTNGDPRFVDELLTEPEGQAAFVKLGPAMFGKFAELHPEGFSNYMAQTFANHIAGSGAEVNLLRLGDFIPADNPKAIEAYNAIVKLFTGIKEMAGKPVSAPKFQTQETNGRQAELDQREERLTRQEWGGIADGIAKKTFDTEWSRLAAGRKVSDDDRGAIEELFHARMDSLIRGNQEFSANAQNFLKAKDKEGYIRFVTAKYKSEIPKAMAAAFSRILPGKPGPKQGQQQTTQPKPATNGAPVDPQYRLVAQRPLPQQINTQLTPQSDILAGRAILRDGSKVRWR